MPVNDVREAQKYVELKIVTKKRHSRECENLYKAPGSITQPLMKYLSKDVFTPHLTFSNNMEQVGEIRSDLFQYT